MAGQKGNADANPEISYGTIHKPVKTGGTKQAVKTGDKSTGSKIETHKNRIRRFLCAHGESKLSDLAQETGLSVSRTRGIIAEMPDVDAIGKNRNRTYRLTSR